MATGTCAAIFAYGRAPLNSLSYDDEFGYYVAPEDVEEDIKETISQNDYDHIFVIMRLRR